jgi:hypothetical protein
LPPGNFTVLGSIANLIVAQSAAARGIDIGFWEDFAVGALTVLTIANKKYPSDQPIWSWWLDFDELSA